MRNDLAAVMPLGFNRIMKTLLVMFLSCLSSLAIADNPYSAESAIYKIEVVVGNVTYSGTGVLLAYDKILTNCHIVNNGGWPRVVHRKSGDIYKVSKYRQLGNFDACILSGDFVGSPVRLSTGYTPGENIWLYGYPAGLPVIGQGSVKGLVDSDKGKVLLLGAFCAHGSSGGPVLNARGELIGLNFGVFQYQNNCLSIPATSLAPLI